MKKYIILILVLVYYLFQLENSSANTQFSECARYEEYQEKYASLYKSTNYNDPSKDDYYESYLDYKTKLEDCESENLEKFSEFFDKGYKSYQSKDYENAVGYYKLAKEIINDDDSTNTNLGLSYFQYGLVLFKKKNYSAALENFNNSKYLSGDDYDVLFNIGLCLNLLKRYSEAKESFNEAYRLAETTREEEEVKNMLSNIIASELKANADTNDSYNYLQYYLGMMNIPSAWNKVKLNYIPNIAIIDDGVDINHPDLTDSIWVNPKAKYGDSKIIDFVGDGLYDNLASGEHGTMIAGIIGAKINNKEGIAGISKGVKIMPLRVFDKNGDADADGDNIVKALEYAINNGAHIINLSLGGSQFKYSSKYDNIIKKAFYSGIPVVIAAGNGDALSLGANGVNLDINPIAPVCNNEGSNEFSIGVKAGDKEGYITNWTNYGGCAKLIAPGVDIISTSITAYNSQYGTNYNIDNGTSFSAPIISGIIALGYNQYGKLSPRIIYNSLYESLTKNSVGNYLVDTEKYIKILGTKRVLQTKVSEMFKKIDKLSDAKKKNTLSSMKKTYIKSRNSASGDKRLVIELTLDEIEKRLNK